MRTVLGWLFSYPGIFCFVLGHRWETDYRERWCRRCWHAEAYSDEEGWTVLD
jgi:hypothetical protein